MKMFVKNDVKIEVIKPKETKTKSKSKVKSVLDAVCIIGFVALGGYVSYECGKLKQWKIDKDEINGLIQKNEALKIFNESYKELLKKEGQA